MEHKQSRFLVTWTTHDMLTHTEGPLSMTLVHKLIRKLMRENSTAFDVSIKYVREGEQ
jgi:hypothetical protein